MKFLPAVVALSFSVAACSSAEHVKSPAPVFNVRIGSRSLGNVPDMFLGTSYETRLLTTHQLDPEDKVLLQLFRNLGGGLLRFGGSSLDYTAWKYPVDGCENRWILKPADLERAFNFARAIGWKVVLGLNLGCFSPEVFGDEAEFAISRGQDVLLALGIGNEPDIYHKNGQRDPLYNYPDFLREYHSYTAAIRRKLSQAPLAGPGTCQEGPGSWFETFLRDEAPNVVLSTHHFYPFWNSPLNPPESPTYPTLNSLLDSGWVKSLRSRVSPLVSTAQRNGRDLRLVETNSVAGGGKENVSDTFASALWGTEMLMESLRLGVRGINFHGDLTRSRYSPIGTSPDGALVARPIYYAMLLFKTAAVGSQIETVTDDHPGLSVYAFKSQDIIRVVVINKGRGTAPLRISVETEYTSAEVIRLMAPTAESKEKITLGGASVSEDGSWRPSVRERLPVAAGQFSDLLPGVSAAVYTLRPE